MRAELGLGSGAGLVVKETDEKVAIKKSISKKEDIKIENYQYCKNYIILI